MRMSRPCTPLTSVLEILSSWKPLVRKPTSRAESNVPVTVGTSLREKTEPSKAVTTTGNSISPEPVVLPLR